ncbi:MAG: RagB/SusD family nutrient uptake outer membrane protein [Tannerella sp.]|jgi:hypothetical protein|nr:RagB/SusD family nutrient uptake outer membrane protein [Tannerella sp.]
MKTYNKIILLISAFFLFISCEGELDQVNPSKATEATFWQTENDFNLALTSCYTPLKNALNGGYYGTRGVMLRIARADEVEFRNDISEVYTVHRFTNSNTNSLVQGMFYQIYNALYRTNSIMQELEKKNFSVDFKNTVRAEALFIRGYYLFVLGKEFKDAPLRLTASQDPETFPLAKSTQKEIYEQAIKDLTEAASLLPMTNIPGKPTKGSALGFLGKIYLYMENWQEAKNTLEPLTRTPYTYRLMQDFNWNFDEAHENNEESLFEILIEDLGGDDVWGNGENINSTQSNTRPKEYAAAEVDGWYEATPTQHMMDIFLKEKDKEGNVDYRARMSAAWNYEGCTYYMKPFQEVFKDKLDTHWILKYQNWQTLEAEPSTAKSYINERALRFAEIILMLAEAELELGNIPASISYINQIRERANLNPYGGAQTSNAVKEELIHQRAVEFFVEGERFYDLRRWGLLKDELQKQDPIRATNFSDKFYYFPIPAKELQTNELCTPSDGW